MILFSTIDLISIFIVVAVAIIITIVLYLYIKYSIKQLESKKLDIEIIDRIIHEKKRSTIVVRKTFNIIKTVIFYVALAIIIPFLAYAIMARIHKQNIPIGNKELMVVGSNSMSYKNEINEYLFNKEEEKFDYQFKYGDIIVLNIVSSADEIGMYDVICYYNPNTGENIIHRIVGMDNNKYQTRGDAWSNDIDEIDTYQSTFNDVVGKYQGHKFNSIGKFILFLQTSIGFATVIALFYLLFMVDYFLKKYNKKELEKIKEFESIIGYDGFVVKYFENDQELEFDYLEIIYLGICYKFNNKGFIEKNKILDDDLINKSKIQIIKRISLNNNISVKEIKIE